MKNSASHQFLELERLEPAGGPEGKGNVTGEWELGGNKGWGGDGASRQGRASQSQVMS